MRVQELPQIHERSRNLSELVGDGTNQKGAGRWPKDKRCVERNDAKDVMAVGLVSQRAPTFMVENASSEKIES